MYKLVYLVISLTFFLKSFSQERDFKFCNSNYSITIFSGGKVEFIMYDTSGAPIRSMIGEFSLYGIGNPTELLKIKYPGSEEEYKYDLIRSGDGTPSLIIDPNGNKFNLCGTNRNNSSSIEVINNVGDIIKDIDGNVYHTIKIGSQVWMVENLNTTKYRNGDPIPNIVDNNEWGILKTGAYCDINNDSNNSNEGRLYNFQSITDSRNIAPEGWHVPTISEWEILINFIGGGEYGYKLSDNSIGFSPIPTSYRRYNGFSNYEFQSANWWTSTEEDSNPWCIQLILGNAPFGNGTIKSTNNVSKNNGYSVRCIKDK